jgi:hypothetical protein
MPAFAPVCKLAVYEVTPWTASSTMRCHKALMIRTGAARQRLISPSGNINPADAPAPRLHRMGVGPIAVGEALGVLVLSFAPARSALLLGFSGYPRQIIAPAIARLAQALEP